MWHSPYLALSNEDRPRFRTITTIRVLLSPWLFQTPPDLGFSKGTPGTQISKANILTWQKSHSPGSSDIHWSVHQMYRWAHCALCMNSASLLPDCDIRPGWLPTMWTYPFCSLLSPFLSLFPPLSCHISWFSSTLHLVRSVGPLVNTDCYLRTLSVLLQSPDLHYLTDFPLSHSSNVLKITFTDVSSAPLGNKVYLQYHRPLFRQFKNCVFSDTQMSWVSPLMCYQHRNLW